MPRKLAGHELSSAPHCPQDELSCALLYDEHISYVSSFALCHVYARSTRSVSIPTRALCSLLAHSSHDSPTPTPMTVACPLPCPLQPDVSKTRASLLSTHPTPSRCDWPSGCWPTPLLSSSTAKSAAESTQSQESMSADEWATAVGEFHRVGACATHQWPITPWMRNNPPTDFPQSQRGGCRFGDCERESAPGALAAGDDCVAQSWTS
ncbi:hypothetical protein B0H10DRAFT_1955782 [Mycena sp. CBHHK59/15]|nr:hypothetical protein B0H10DRAFT_1955782 [Mycena sp. CBHHK59/15]